MSIYKQFIYYVESFHRLIDLEQYEFLGLGLDRWGHFLLVWLFSQLLLLRFKPRGVYVFGAFVIFFKEFLDFSILWHYRDFRMIFFIDMGIDLFLGFLGMLTAHLIYKNNYLSNLFNKKAKH